MAAAAAPLAAASDTVRLGFIGAYADTDGVPSALVGRRDKDGVDIPAFELPRAPTLAHATFAGLGSHAVMRDCLTHLPVGILRRNSSKKFSRKATCTEPFCAAPGSAA